jgi:hypothetical protein
MVIIFVKRHPRTNVAITKRKRFKQKRKVIKMIIYIEINRMFGIVF